MIERFRVATRATGIRRQVFVHIYEDRDELARRHTEARNMPYDPEADIAGGVVTQQGFHWPTPDYTPIIVMRLWTVPTNHEDRSPRSSTRRSAALLHGRHTRLAQSSKSRANW